MASGTAKAADDLSAGVRSIVDRVLDADVTETIAQRGKELAAMLADATETAADRAQNTLCRHSNSRRSDQSSRRCRESRKDSFSSRRKPTTGSYSDGPPKPAAIP